MDGRPVERLLCPSDIFIRSSWQSINWFSDPPACLLTAKKEKSLFSYSLLLNSFLLKHQTQDQENILTFSTLSTIFSLLVRIAFFQFPHQIHLPQGNQTRAVCLYFMVWKKEDLTTNFHFSNRVYINEQYTSFFCDHGEMSHGE